MGRIGRRAFWAGVLAVLMTLSGIPSVSPEPNRAENPLDMLMRLCRTPDQLAQYLRRNVVFQDDALQFGLVDYWQDPEELLERRQGDCEDYALLAQAVLARLGREAFVFSLYGRAGYAHTVCVFVEDGRYSVINQDRLVWYRAGSLKELADLLYPTWDWGAVAERYGHRGRPVREIHNGVAAGRVFH